MRKALSVKQFNEYIKSNIKHDPIFQKLYISGEIANLRINNNHLYFSLKEDYDIIDCVIYYYEDKDIDFQIETGKDVIVKGNLFLNNYSSRIIISCSEIIDIGLSLEYQNFLKMKEDFRKKGYFDQSRKKSIPKFPSKVGLITSKDGAAIVDFLAMINSKANDIHIYFYPVKVQGLDSAKLIVEAIKKLDSLNLDVIVITRGGGSNEDLSSFNDREIIESVYSAKSPIISAIGHNIDRTLLDLVSDLSLQTPTEAGSYLAQNYDNYKKDLKILVDKIREKILSDLHRKQLELRVIENKLFSHNPKKVLEEKKKNLDFTKSNISAQVLKTYKQYKDRLDILLVKLEARKSIIEINKRKIVILNSKGKEIYSRYSLKEDDQITIKFSDGQITARICDE